MRNFLPNKQVTKIAAMSMFMLFATFATEAPVSAELMTSTNFKVQGDSLNLGGVFSTSTNFKGVDTIGEIASGEGLSSTNFTACSGFECFGDAPSITFSVAAGTSSPGTPGAGIALGALTTAAINGSNGTTINSVFLTLETNAVSGTVVTVVSDNGALERVSVPSATLDSATANLSSSSGYGVCVQTATEDAGTDFTKVAPYASTCDKSSNHNVGIIDTTIRNILTTSGTMFGGAAEVLIKAKSSSVTPAGDDYTDTVTFIATGTY